MKLSPKPDVSEPLDGWEELDHLLQTNFKKHPPKGEVSKVTIDSNDYQMSAQEIVDEAKQQGYKAEIRPDSHYIYFY